MTHPAEVRGGAGLGLASALAAAVVGGLVWSLITITTNYKIGLFAIGIGLLVGKAVEHFGGGDARLPLPAALIALLGCAIGDIFSDIHAIAQQHDASDLRTAGDMLSSPAEMWRVYKAGFQAMDLVFYAIAAYEGFRFAKVGVLKAQYAHQQATAPAQYPAQATESAPAETRQGDPL